MAVVKELIRTEENGGISFGNYELPTKSKASDFPYQGDVYKVKTFKEITKLEKNGKMLLEAVPGATVLNFAQDERGVSFLVEAEEDVQLTLELEADTEYKILVDDVNVGKMKTNMTGKVTFSVEIQKNATPVKIEKIG